MTNLGTQHTDMFEFGERGTRFSVEAMRRQAHLRLKQGWSTSIHRHSITDDCKAQQWDCEFYAVPDGGE